VTIQLKRAAPKTAASPSGLPKNSFNDYEHSASANEKLHWLPSFIRSEFGDDEFAVTRALIQICSWHKLPHTSAYVLFRTKKGKFSSGRSPTRVIEAGELMVESNTLQALLTLLDPDPVAAAEAYRRLQQRLLRFFHLTAASDPQQLTDKTIDSLARRAAEAAAPASEPSDPALTEGPQPIGPSPAALVFSTARQVLQEDQSGSQPDDQDVREWLARTTNAPDPNLPQRQAILQSCLSRLSAERRQMLEKYYGWNKRYKAEHHSQLAQSLGLGLDTLRHRVLRSRVQLESCVRRKQANAPHRSRIKGRKA
jgi:hypothetical protein